ncbi:hypothetical protein EON66_07630 [archaeon]|nr:MAG: hypothetical protein EON66_07630 [archaeon]
MAVVLDDAGAMESTSEGALRFALRAACATHDHEAAAHADGVVLSIRERGFWESQLSLSERALRTHAPPATLAPSDACVRQYNALYARHTRWYELLADA